MAHIILKVWETLIRLVSQIMSRENMTRIICPECQRKGSLRPLRRELKSGEKVIYWEVVHGDFEKICYLGKGPHEIEVIKDDRAPIGTETEVFE